MSPASGPPQSHGLAIKSNRRRYAFGRETALAPRISERVVVGCAVPFASVGARSRRRLGCYSTGRTLHRPWARAVCRPVIITSAFRAPACANASRVVPLEAAAAEAETTGRTANRIKRLTQTGRFTAAVCARALLWWSGRRFAPSHARHFHGWREKPAAAAETIKAAGQKPLSVKVVLKYRRV